MQPEPVLREHLLGGLPLGGVRGVYQQVGFAGDPGRVSSLGAVPLAVDPVCTRPCHAGSCPSVRPTGTAADTSAGRTCGLSITT